MTISLHFKSPLPYGGATPLSWDGQLVVCGCILVSKRSRDLMVFRCLGLPGNVLQETLQRATVTMGPVVRPCPSAVVDPGSALSSVYLPGASRPAGGLSAGLSRLTVSCCQGTTGPTSSAPPPGLHLPAPSIATLSMAISPREYIQERYSGNFPNATGRGWWLRPRLALALYFKSETPDF